MAGMHSKPENCHTKLDVVSMVTLGAALQHAEMDSSVKHWNDMLRYSNDKP